MQIKNNKMRKRKAVEKKLNLDSKLDLINLFNRVKPITTELISYELIKTPITSSLCFFSDEVSLVKNIFKKNRIRKIDKYLKISKNKRIQFIKESKRNLGKGSIIKNLNTDEINIIFSFIGASESEIKVVEMIEKHIKKEYTFVYEGKNIYYKKKKK